ncbi:histone RNA hairpin-binding protein [Spodoptera litura]|uniref:Histone RNA hairpin-binding protein n=1 Tax=Spodoptera litura TaxID=69820 RepID=A0A9J7IG85_SPOLT|nr:histone RNA hairpin-binding protein [Spodoptera litura]XP_022814017.1 histone RNA hairpin-binding protein [Spodoptera litura]
MNSVTSKRSWAAELEMEETRENSKSTRDKSSGSRENSNSRKKARPNSKSESEKKESTPRKPLELETDPLVLRRRQKQIDYGKNTVGYYNYTNHVRYEERTKDHPKTPDKFAKYSRRSWDTLIKLWRKKLHEYDVDGQDDCLDNEEDSDNQD